MIHGYLSSTAYHSGDLKGLSRSNLVYLAESPKNFERPLKIQSKALDFGSCFHDLLNEPQTLFKTYCFEPKRPEGLKLTTKEGRAWKKEHIDSLPDDKIKISWPEEELLHSMVFEFKKYKAAQHYLSGKKEWAFTEDIEGVLFKCKVDSFSPDDNVLYDLKTIDSISKIESSMYKHKYFLQAYLYSMIVGFNVGSIPSFRFIFVEKKMNPAVGFFEIDNDHWNIGEKQFYSVLEKYKKNKLIFEQGLYEVNPWKN